MHLGNNGEAHPEKDWFLERRRLGQISLRVSIVGFGASPLGDVFGKTGPKEGAAAVHAAIDYGITYFDVSPYYGITVAEKRLGEALEGRRHEVILATECGRYAAISSISRRVA